MLLLNQDAICNMKTNEFTPENESMKKKKHFDQTKTLLLFSKILISFSSHNQPHHFFTTICDHDFANDLQSPLDLSLVA